MQSASRCNQVASSIPQICGVISICVSTVLSRNFCALAQYARGNIVTPGQLRRTESQFRFERSAAKVIGCEEWATPQTHQNTKQKQQQQQQKRKKATKKHGRPDESSVSECVCLWMGSYMWYSRTESTLLPLALFEGTSRRF